jgi:hypothetical protein
MRKTRATRKRWQNANFHTLTVSRHFRKKRQNLYGVQVVVGSNPTGPTINAGLHEGPVVILLAPGRKHKVAVHTSLCRLMLDV